MTPLSGLKALVVEDEAAVALLIEDMLFELGCGLAASVSRLPAARAAAANVACDFAVLDVNLDGQLVFPVAHILAERRIPFVFSTGYGPGFVPAEFSSRPVLSKPFALEDLQRTLLRAIRGE
jgi:CheY-like chemotaxis protein